MRTIKSEQIIGAILIRLLDNEKTEIEIKEIFRIIRKANNKLFKLNQTVVHTLSTDMCTAINMYVNCIETDNGFIRFSAKAMEKDKEELIDTLDSYFVAGLPLDIDYTVMDSIP